MDYPEKLETRMVDLVDLKNLRHDLQIAKEHLRDGNWVRAYDCVFLACEVVEVLIRPTPYKPRPEEEE